MKKIKLLYLLSCLFLVMSANAQNPVTWTFSTTTINNKGEYILSFKANIQKGWYLYSQNIPNQPPIPTTISFNSADKQYTLSGKITENGKAIDEYDEVNKQTIRKYSSYVVFETRAKTQAEVLDITGEIRYMTCNDSRCLPPRNVPFSFKIFNINDETPDFTVKNNSLKPQGAKSYADETYFSADGSIALTDDATDVSKAGQKRKSVTLPPNSTHETVNIEETGNLVGANVLRFMPKPKPAKIAKAKPAPPRPTPPPPAVTDPVTWDFALVPTKEKGIYTLQMTAQMVKDWYLYSQHNSGDIPMATAFKFENSDHIEWLDKGTVTEKGDLVNSEDAVFHKNTQRFAQKVVFERTVKFKQNVPVYGSVSFMAADDLRYNLPREQTFSVNSDLNVVPVPQSATASIVGVSLLLLAGIALIAWVSRKPKTSMTK